MKDIGIAELKHTAFTRRGALFLRNDLNRFRRWHGFNTWHYYLIDHKTGEIVD